ncbi:polar amino acid transport system permease protein [Devosia enhydra]|uniref:Polar amino acid transport system permease protein n=1 Tax=Devosia enhydra TaxID=665118 RepID=A0A1K2HXX4_9HYPH|nr:amino acid ABC transporter permease [Devosia enhydra]SFZ84669.1 polar amino acid transport system permease protein [Devosia enhydra]
MFQQFSLNHVYFMLTGLGWTIGLAAIALIGGSIAGSVLTLMRVSANPVLSRIAQVYIFVVQGTPLLVTLFIAYFGSTYLGFTVAPLTAIAVAFSFYAAAFLGDIWRGAIQSVPVGQREGAHALGLSGADTMRHIIIPQAIRIATPPTVGFFVQLIKNTSLASVVGIVELTRTAQIVSNATFKPLEVYLTAALFYFLVCFPITLFSRRLEKRLSV